MKHVEHRFFTISQYEKEEKWLNEKAQAGELLVEAGFCRYVFEDGPKGEYIYRLELLEDWWGSEKTRDYIKFMDGLGIEYLGHCNNWVYFRKRASEGPFDIYSDLDSKIAHYSRMRSLCLSVMPLLLATGILNIVNSTHAFSRGETSLGVGMLTLGTLVVVIGVWVVGVSVPLFSKLKRLKREKAIRE